MTKKTAFDEKETSNWDYLQKAKIKENVSKTLYFIKEHIYNTGRN